MLRKEFANVVRSLDEAKRTITFVASTEDTDRYGDIIRVRGWKLANYKRNGVFLWGHRSGDPPIGKCVDIWTEFSPPALVQKIEFASKDVYPFADTIYKLYRGGFLKAVSVGFVPTEEPKEIRNSEGQRTGEEFVGQELLELSAVSVPANPEALGRAVTKGVVTDGEMREFKRCALANLSLPADFLAALEAEEKEFDEIKTLDELFEALQK